MALDSGAVLSATPSISRDEGRTKSAESLPARSRQLRARFEKGVFVPVGQVDLPEGTEVMIDLRNPQQK
jgi:hypothetical protein